MNKVILSLFASAFAASALAAPPRKVQGVPYVPRESRDIQLASDYPEDPGDLATPEGNFTFDMIQNWSGEGSKRAALVIQWNDSREKTALVFGYRWDGQATGADMLREVVSANPRLYTLMQYTNVSSPTDPDGGYTINGLGWDLDADGEIALRDTGNGNQIYTCEDYTDGTGFFKHPRGYVPGQGGSSDYDYDNWQAVDEDDFWGAGWYISYWSYWVKDSQEASFSYSSWGASGRVLEDGSWDGWNFSVYMMPSDWKLFEAAPANMPEGTQTEFKVDGLYYTLNNYAGGTVSLSAPFEMEGETLSSYTGDITVPAVIEGEGFSYKVVEVADGAFKNAQIGTVSLPASVTKIGKAAFENSTLSDLVLAEGAAVPALGENAFAGCSRFSKFILPEGITAIPAGLYSGTAISSVILPEGVETVGERAFADCSALTEVYLPGTVKTVGAEAFAACDNIAKVTVDTTFPPAAADNAFSAAAYNAAVLTVPSGFSETYGQTAGWSNFSKSAEYAIAVNVGDLFTLNGVSYRVLTSTPQGGTLAVTYHKTEGAPNRTTIAAANKAGYTGAVTIPSSITYQELPFTVAELNDSVFYGASALESVVLPEGLTTIPAFAFYDCSKLASVAIPASVTTIQRYAFSYCSVLNNVVLPEGLTSLGERSFFQATGMTSINIPASLTTIPTYCFSYCKALETVKLHDGITSLGTYAFQQCSSLVEVILPSGLKELPSNLFQNCTSLPAVVIPAGVTSIGSTVFSGCSSLKNIELPAGLTTLGSSVFTNCSALEEVEPPAGVTTLGSSLFSGCKALRKVTMSPSITSVPASLFDNCSSLTTLLFHGENADAAQPGVIRIPEGVTTIGQYAFRNCTSVKDVILPESGATLSGWIFQNSGLTELVVPAATLYARSTPNYLCANNTAVNFYICSPVPTANVTRFTFAKASGSYPYPVMVPTGSIDAYKALTSTWAYYPLCEPTLNGLGLDSVRIENAETGMVIRGCVTPAYAEQLPARFAASNLACVFGEGSTTVLKLSSASRADIEIPVTVAADGSFEGTVEGVDPTASYTASATLTRGESSFNSASTSVEIAVKLSPAYDPAAAKVWIGEGESRALVTFRWNDGKGVENIVLGYRFNEADSVSCADMIAAVIEGDRRFSGDASNISFDLNGDGTVQTAYDHCSADAADTRWTFFCAPAYGTSFSECTAPLADGNNILVEYTAANAPSEAEYLMYLPADEQGAWLPELRQINIADTYMLPVLINVGEGNSLMSLSCTRVDENGTSATAQLKTVMLTNPAKGNTQASVTFGGATGKVFVKVKPNIKNAAGTLIPFDAYSNEIEVDVLAPERPVTALAYESDAYLSNFDETLTPVLTLTPADATYTKINYESSDASVASVSTTGKITVKRTEGVAVITASYALDPEVKATYTITVTAGKKVERFVLGTGSDTINVTYMDIIGLEPTVEPADAAIKTYDVAISDGDVATLYSVRGFNPSRSFYELVTHKPGSVDVTFKAQDGSGVESTYHINVLDPDRSTAADNWQDGTFWLNEDWFGHTNGSINYIDVDGNIRYRAYESQNPYESFGCTSQYAMIFGDKLYVMSKQATDGGDPRRGGGRVVVADAKTLKKLAAFDSPLGAGDGRACVGVSSSKVYFGTTAGIAVFNPQTLEITGSVSGIEAGSLYANQLGDMVCAGKYVFAVKQDVGTLVIDTDTDEVVATLGQDEDGNCLWHPHGVARTADSRVWVAANSSAGATTLFCYDADDYSLVREVAMPSHMRITCGWGAWRPTNFFASAKTNELWFGSGVEASIVSGNTGYYRWDTESDLETLQPVFVFPSKLEGIDSTTYQAPYAAVRYDERADELLVAATHGASSNYRYNWYHFIDCATGEIARTTRLKDYYWFPAMPVFPDKYGVQFDGLEGIDIVSDASNAGQASVIDLADYATDPDNQDCGIRYSLVAAPEALDDSETAVAEYTLDGSVLSVMPLTDGSDNITIAAESNGKVTTVNIPVSVRTSTSVADVEAAAGTIRAAGNCVTVKGFEGVDFYIFDMAGNMLRAFTAQAETVRYVTMLPVGVYIVTTADGSRSAKVLLTE